MSREQPKLNILIAYPYFKSDMQSAIRQYPKSRYRLIVDSGAFTAWNTGKTIELKEYCKFLESISDLLPFHAVQLDVFGDPARSYSNLLEMHRLGFKDVMPVFTRGESLERLEEFYRMTDYIMFGGIVIGGKNKNYVKWFLERNGKRKAHWLGFVNMPFIKHYRPESADSSSWLSAARYGNLQLYSGYGEVISIEKKEFTAKPSERVRHVATKNGIGDRELFYLSKSAAWIDSGSTPTLEREEKNIAKFITCIGHTLRSYEVEKQLGTKIYLTASTIGQLHMIFAARDFLEKRGMIR